MDILISELFFAMGSNCTHSERGTKTEGTSDGRVETDKETKLRDLGRENATRSGDTVVDGTVNLRVEVNLGLPREPGHGAVLGAVNLLVKDGEILVEVDRAAASDVLADVPDELRVHLGETCQT